MVSCETLGVWTASRSKFEKGKHSVIIIIIIISHHHHIFHHHHQELLFHHPLKQARKLRDEVYGSETYMPTNQVKISIAQRNQVVIQRSSWHLLNIPTNQVKKNFANSKIKILGSPASSLKSLFSTISTTSTILLILITNQISIPIILSILCILGYLGLGSALFCQWEGTYNDNDIITITLLQ